MNLEWALRRMDGVVRENPHKTVPEILQLLERESLAIRKEDIAMCTAISENGLKVLKDGDSILTHCNTCLLYTSTSKTKYGGIESGLFVMYFEDSNLKVPQEIIDEAYAAAEKVAGGELKLPTTFDEIDQWVTENCK